MQLALSFAQQRKRRNRLPGNKRQATNDAVIYSAGSYQATRAMRSSTRQYALELIRATNVHQAVPDNASDVVVYQAMNARQQTTIQQDNARRRGRRNHQLGDTPLKCSAPRPSTKRCPTRQTTQSFTRQWTPGNERRSWLFSDHVFEVNKEARLRKLGIFLS